MGKLSATAFVLLLSRVVSSSSSTSTFAFTVPPPRLENHHGRVGIVSVTPPPHSRGWWWCRNHSQTSPARFEGIGDDDRVSEDLVSSSSPLAVQGGNGDDDEGLDRVERRRDVTSLKRWAIAEGIRLADGVELTSVGADEGAGDGDDDWGVSIVRPDELTGGEVVLGVPRSLVLSSRTTLERHMHGGDDNDVDDPYRPACEVLESAGLVQYKPELILVIEILTELSRGESSRWHTWLRSLPTTFDTGVHMDELERSFLPPVALALVRLEDRKLDAFRAAIDALVMEADGRDSFGELSRMVESTSGDEGGGYSDVGDYDDAVRWAYDVVFTRCWRRSGEMGPDADACIVPLGDMFNHREPSNVFVRDDEDGPTVDIVLKHDLLVDADSGGHGETGLYLSYGLPDPHRYLVMFGFVDETMPEIYSQLMFPHPNEDLLSLGCNDVSEMVFRTEDGRIANAVWDCALYAIISASEDEAKREGDLRALLDAHQRGDAAAKAALHHGYSLEVCAYLWRHVDATLADLPTNFGRGECSGGDEETMAKDHPRLHLVLRHNEFVGRVFQKVKHRLEWMISTELRRRGEKP